MKLPDEPTAALRLIATTTFRAMNESDFETWPGAPENGLIGERDNLVIIVSDEFVSIYAADGGEMDYVSFELRW